jgi:carboxyl-terminal processing protease
VRRHAVLVFIVLSLPLRAEAQSRWNEQLVASVYAKAFAFMQPRTLAPIPLADLALWGLRGLTALDPSISPAIGGGKIALYDRGQPVLSMPMPKPGDAAGWGSLASLFCARAASLSPGIAEAGPGGVVTNFFDELFNHLDPYSRYVAPMSQETDMPPADLGFTIGLRGHQAVVTDIAPGGPAFGAGLGVGDRILAIDGVPTRGKDSYTLNGALVGQAGSIVTLRVQSAHGRPRNLPLHRAAEIPETVFASAEGRMLMLRISGFEPGTADTFRGLLTQGLAARPAPAGIILDLRGNRGGLLEQAVRIAADLIPQGIIARARGRDPEADQQWQGDGQDMAHGLPIAVLVDGRTASAAEVLSAALADDGRAVVIGSATFGKGLVQAATALPDGGHLLVTWALLLAPLGWPLQGLGLLPQICTSGGADAVENQLQALSGGEQPMAGALAAERRARPGISIDQILRLREACPAALGSGLDDQAARFLLTTPPAYQAALIARP